MTSAQLQQLTEIEQPTNPFPGLRPFEFHENHLFFGREGQSEQLIAKLNVSRFLAVVGTSGSGKSSLVRAGLLPALFGGLMGKTGSRWRVAIMRPGNDPIGNLARALDAPDVFGTAGATPSSVQQAMTEALLRRSSLSLVEVTRQAQAAAGEHLLVLVDQFEELFRVEQSNTSQEAENEKAAFVKLLLAAKDQRELPIYVVLTMRSDYLGDCAQFWDLPEAINESQYLIPRLTREQRREVITGPVAVGGADITSRLVNRLLNDVGDNPDQLPILQHALMRTWDQWQEAEQPGEPLDLPHYESIGGLTGALSRHADEAYDDLSPAQQRVAERTFKCLTEKGADNREVRRPQTVRELSAVTQVDEQDVIAVIEVFRRPGRSFLMPPAEVLLTADSLIDISHESLIRNWEKLKSWVEEEAQSAATYKRLAERAELYELGKEDLLRDPGLQLALEWQTQQQPHDAWARRYHSGLAATVTFLQQSQKAQADEAKVKKRQHQRERIRRLILFGFTLMMLLMSMLMYYFEDQRHVALKREKASRSFFYVANMNFAGNAFTEGNLTRGHGLLNTFLPRVDGRGQDDLRGFDWYYLWRRYHQELATLVGHVSSVESVAFSSDGKTLASGSGDNTIKLWDLATRQVVTTLTGHAGVVESVAFAPDGKMLASASFDKTIKLWDVTTGQVVATLMGHADVVESVAFAPDGKMLASASFDKTIKLWDVATGQVVATLMGHRGAVLSVAFAPDGKMLASGSGDNTIKLWGVDTRQDLFTLTGHKGSVTSIAFSSDRKILASVSWDGTVKLWNVSTHQLLDTLAGHTGFVTAVIFSPNGETLISGSRDNTVKLWDMGSHQEQATLVGHMSCVGSVAFSPDGKMLASGSDDKTIKLWDLVTRQVVTTLTGHMSVVEGVTFAPDGKTLASGSDDKTIKLWDVATGRELATLTGHMSVVEGITFAPDGKTLASARRDNTIKLWDVGTRQELATLTGHSASVLSVVFSPDGTTLASASADGTVKLWDMGTRQELATLTGHSASVLSVVFSPDGTTLASASADGTVKLWNVGARQELATLTGHSNFVMFVTFSPDGKTLASGSSDKTIKLWDVVTGQELATLKGHESGVQNVAFAPDGKTLASGSDDKTIRLYFAATDEEVERQRNR